MINMMHVLVVYQTKSEAMVSKILCQLGQPGFRFLVVADVERVFGMTGLTQSEMKQRLTGFDERCRNMVALLTKRAMGSPGTDHLIRPGRTVQNYSQIIWSDRVRRAFHIARISGPKGKDIGRPKSSIPQGARAPLAALNGWIVLDLRGGRRVEHHKHHPCPRRIPDPAEAISVLLAVGIDRG